jgi:hypothetical protein
MLVRVGLRILVAGAGADVASHLVNGGVGISGMIGHGLTLTGMLVAVIGVLRVALHPEPRLDKRGGNDVRADLAVR